MKKEKVSNRTSDGPINSEVISEVLHSDVVAGQETKARSSKRRRKTEKDLKNSEDLPSGLMRTKPNISEEEASLIDASSIKATKQKTTKVKDQSARQGEGSVQKVVSKVKAELRDGENADLHKANGQGLKRKRKTREEKEEEAMPLAARSSGLKMFVGAHVSIAKGVQNSVTNCVHIGGNAFAMFLKSQRKWENPPLQEESKDQFKAFCSEHKYDSKSQILPHGSYLVNLAQENPEKAEQAYEAFLDDMKRCEALGIKLYNFHPGSTGPHPRPSAIARIAQALNRAHAATNTVIPILECMAGGGNIVGSTFEDLRDIIALIHDKTRIGVCIDTCHVFAAGYDLRTPKAFNETLKQFNQIVGSEYLRALHINDSKAPFASHRDLHQNIGLGFLGLRAFHSVMNEKQFEGLPLVLETPIDTQDKDGKQIEDKRIWTREIKMLESLIGMDAASDKFMEMERELAEKGAAERAKLQEAFDRKQEKDRKALEKGQTKLAFGGKKATKTRERMTSEEKD